MQSVSVMPRITKKRKKEFHGKTSAKIAKEERNKIERDRLCGE